NGGQEHGLIPRQTDPVRLLVRGLALPLVPAFHGDQTAAMPPQFAEYPAAHRGFDSGIGVVAGSRGGVVGRGIAPMYAIHAGRIPRSQAMEYAGTGSRRDVVARAFRVQSLGWRQIVPA